MSDGLTVDPQLLVATARQLREQASSLDDDTARLPDVDGGVMTPVIESAVHGVLSTLTHLAGALTATAASIEESALDYHDTDLVQAERMIRLMMPRQTERHAAAAAAESVGHQRLWERLDARVDTPTEKLGRLLTGAPPEGGRGVD